VHPISNRVRKRQSPTGGHPARGKAAPSRGAAERPLILTRVFICTLISSLCFIAQVDVLDTTGAGDGFLGGFLHYTLKKGARGCQFLPEACGRSRVERLPGCGSLPKNSPALATLGDGVLCQHTTLPSAH